MVLASGGAGGILMIVAYIAFFVLIMYFVAIRPQKKQQKFVRQLPIRTTTRMVAYIFSISTLRKTARRFSLTVK